VRCRPCGCRKRHCCVGRKQDNPSPHGGDIQVCESVRTPCLGRRESPISDSAPDRKAPRRLNATVPRDLLRRPQVLELALDNVAEPPAPCELRSLGSQRPTLRTSIGWQRPILRPTAVRVHLPTDRRSRTAQPLRDRPDRQASGQTPRDLLAFLQRQPKLTTLPSARTPSTRIGDELPHRRVLTPQMLRDPLHGHARLAHIPDRLPVLLRKPNHTNTSRSTRSMLANQDRVALIS
jgi:hypothetical protein